MSHYNDPQHTMNVNGLKAILNTPEALKGEGLNALPPHDPQPAYVVDEYPACPQNWMHGSDKASSYFVPVEAGRGMWFDFTANQNHKHHVAVVISVQGINPVTGQQIAALNMEQYKTMCPLHKVDFQQDRFCPECKYKWSAQNYISTTTGKTLWIDGFRNEKGEVRQYIITEEQARGIAYQIAGDERVFAIGFAFYLSKEPKPQPVRSFGFSTCCSFDDTKYSAKYSAQGFSVMRNAEYCAELSECLDETETRLEIGAGSRIQQEVGIDPENIDFWEPTPAGLIYVNYIPEEAVKKILDAGKRQEKKDGFLGELKVGN